LIEGSVTKACGKANKKPLCWGKSSSFNVDGCVSTTKGVYSMYSVAELLGCVGNITEIKKCKEMLGIFTAMKGYSGGTCGVTAKSYCTHGKSSTSSSSSQYWAICGEPRATTTTPPPTTITMGHCVDTGCQKTFLAEDVEAECVYLKNSNWISISHTYNASTPWKEGLCKSANSEEDCCKCLPRLPVGCVDVKHACRDAFGGFGVCKNFVKDDMSAIDFDQGSKKGLCNVDDKDCCECFAIRNTTTTAP